VPSSLPAEVSQDGLLDQQNHLPRVTGGQLHQRPPLPQQGRQPQQQLSTDQIGGQAQQQLQEQLQLPSAQPQGQTAHQSAAEQLASNLRMAEELRSHRSSKKKRKHREDDEDQPRQKKHKKEKDRKKSGKDAGGICASTVHSVLT